MKREALAEYVHHLTDCPGIGRGDQHCTCGAPSIIADVELAYGLLWCVLGTDQRTHRARMILARVIGPDGMRRGLSAVPAEDRPDDGQMIELFLGDPTGDIAHVTIQSDVTISHTAAEFDLNVERLKACEHIAEGEEGWEEVRNLCPSTAAVATLRDHAGAMYAALNGMLDAFRMYVGHESDPAQDELDAFKLARATALEYANPNRSQAAQRPAHVTPGKESA